MTPYKQALQDIHNELKQSSRSFIAFRKELNPIMDEIVNNAIKEQEEL